LCKKFSKENGVSVARENVQSISNFTFFKLCDVVLVGDREKLRGVKKYE
jgi:hypothetical protein